MKILVMVISLPMGLSAVQAQSVSIELLYNWTNPNFAPSTVFANTYNECWGFVQGGREYGVMGSSWGTHFFDLSDPTDIRAVDSVLGAFSGPGVIHRDYHDHKGYLYAVCDEGSGISTLQIIDLQYLPDSVVLAYDSKEKFSTAHNIFIDSTRDRMYAFLVGFAPGFSSVAVYSLEDPLDPFLLKVYNAGTQVHDGFVRNDTAFFNDGFNGRILMMNWADVDNPEIIGSLDSYPDRGYNHSGWWHATRPIYVFADENHGAKMKVCDVSDPTDITVLSTFFSEADASSIVHNQLFRGDYLFSAHYHDGLYIHDLSDPANPQYVAHYKTYLPDDHVSYRGAWGVYPLLPSGLVIVSDMQYGFFVFRVNGLSLGMDAEPSSLQVQQVWPNPFSDWVRVQVESRVAQSGRMYISDLKGRVLAEQRLDLLPGMNALEMTLDPNWSSGLYLLRLEAGVSGISEQLVKLGRD